MISVTLRGFIVTCLCTDCILYVFLMMVKVQLKGKAIPVQA